MLGMCGTCWIAGQGSKRNTAVGETYYPSALLFSPQDTWPFVKVAFVNVLTISCSCCFSVGYVQTPAAGSSRRSVREKLIREMAQGEETG